MKWRIALLVSLLGLVATSALAADICEAIALRDVPALESPTDILREGQYDTAITQYRIDRNTGNASFCSHGGYCYPASLNIAGRRIEALRLTNCKIGGPTSFQDSDYKY
jgi:hypothetical protein